MVKQIRNGKLLEDIMERGDGYFHWLQEKSGLSGPLSSMLAETEFVSLYGLDDILEQSAKEAVRQNYTDYLREKDGLNDKDAETINKSIRGGCCLFEVMLHLADSISEMLGDEDSSKFFAILLENCGMDKYDEEDWDMRSEEVKQYWQKCIDRILKREYTNYGGGGLFPVKPFANARSGEFSVEEYDETYSDRRDVPLWQQMNDWVDQHTNEDGEWVD